ncbi:Sodium/calcium exchanger 3 [Willisornis vidua]|uniref:Sodium/calcium exchanger 3 n=1 Tax=Willisornis vidua TaxID=1566151 RepID=A0ABQ9DEW5_9PASS|nr:Sodium/calcium exchanger 3 [Willisornis vidua]
MTQLLLLLAGLVVANLRPAWSIGRNEEPGQDGQDYSWFLAFLDLHSGSCILCMAWLSLQPVTSAFLHFGLVTFVLFLHGLQVDAGLTGDSTSSVQNSSCSGSFDCKEGVILPIWYPENPSLGDKIARVIVYFVALIYMFLGVSIIADRFMASIEVITSQEKEITIKKPNGETTTTTIRIWNETVSNLTLMALGSSAPEILLSLIEVCGHGFIAGDLGPSTIVGSAAFNMFIIIAICVYVIPDGETRKIKHLRVFFVTAAWSIFAYIWLYMILAVFSPGVVQVWEGLLTLFFFPLCVLLAWIADRRLLFYKYMHKKYRTDKHRGIIIESEGDHPKGIEMDGKMMNSHFLDGNLVTVEGKEVDESRKEMIRILKDLKQKHPEKDLDQLVEMANYYALSHQQKSRAFYRIQATRMMTGAGNILKKHAAEQAKKSTSLHEVRPEEPEEFISKIYFDPCSYQCLENCGAVLLTVVRKGGDVSKTIYVDYKTEDGSANAGADYEFTEGTVVLKSGETQKEFSVGIIDDDIFEEDEHFFVRLSNLRVVESEEPPELSNSPYPKAILASPCVATVTILDDDHAGIFTFECDIIHVSESIGVMEVKVLRTSGARGTVIVPFRTVEGTAKGGGEDFEDTYGELEFKNDETVSSCGALLGVRNRPGLDALLHGDFNLPEINWEHHTSGTVWARRFLKNVDDNFMEQVLRELTQKNAILGLLLVSRVDLMSKAEIGGHLGHSDHEVIEFKISVDRRKSANKTSALDMRRADFRLLRELEVRPGSQKFGVTIQMYALTRACCSKPECFLTSWKSVNHNTDTMHDTLAINTVENVMEREF